MPFPFALKFTEWVNHEYGDARIRARPWRTGKHTSRQNTHSYTALTRLAAAGCKCIKNAVCDVCLREKTASWHRWHGAKIQLITANIRPPPRKAAQTTNTSSRREPKSKDLEAEEALNRVKDQGRAVGEKRPIGDRINRWNMPRKAQMWEEIQRSGVAEPLGGWGGLALS